jgi:hypothetical protein
VFELLIYDDSVFVSIPKYRPTYYRKLLSCTTCNREHPKRLCLLDMTCAKQVPDKSLRCSPILKVAGIVTVYLIYDTEWTSKFSHMNGV